MKKLILTAFAAFLAVGLAGAAEKIDRYAVISRHNPLVTHATNIMSPAQVGNGKFAFGMDITGLQTYYPFNTVSDWSWHSFPLPDGVKREDYKPVPFESHGKTINYLLQNPECQEISTWLKGNPHRFNLGRLGMTLLKSDGSVALEKDLSGCTQESDIWTGAVTSSFSLEGTPVKVVSACDPEKDMIEVTVKSEYLKNGRYRLFLDLPYANMTDPPEDTISFGDYHADEYHQSFLSDVASDGAVVTHIMDSTVYYIKFHWTGDASIKHISGHKYEIVPSGSDTFTFFCLFTPDKQEQTFTNPGEVFARSAEGWKKYWMSGAAIDFSECTDPRWFELERKVVLSQYVMKMNEAGTCPPQEQGLVSYGWFGRFHWEMIWWHAAHYMLWNRFDCLKYLDKYQEFLPAGIKRAQQEGRKGVKWPKCTGPFYSEWPSDIHSWLVFQEPHPIWFAEEEYRCHPCQEVLDKWRDVVINTADYIADDVFWDKDNRRYVIGPPVCPVSENTDYTKTMNPCFEVEYFHYGLKTALKWADRLGLPKSRTKQWREVLKKLTPMPVEDGYYITYEGMPDMWHNYNFEHPALTGIYGWLPGDDVDIPTFTRTFYRVLKDWKIERIWGWDFPMMAMAAARLGDPNTALDLLCGVKYDFRTDVHGLSLSWPYPYFPASGGLLSAIAMMCEGWDGSDGPAPGFPKDGTWNVKYEGFNKMQ